MQKIYPSVHTYELFMPLERDERRMAGVLKPLAELGFYRGVETGIFFEKENIHTVRDICERNGLSLTMWASPYLQREQLSLSSLDDELRERSIQKAILLLNYAVECGADKIGMPSGDYLGDALCAQATEALTDSLSRIGRVAERFPGLHLVLEPLDRYVHKKQLMGPMREVCAWFAELRQVCPGIYLHWDSAHEALGGIDLMESLELAGPYLEQLHLCSAVTDSSHPLYGDWHMDMGQPPDFETPGFLTPEVGAQILRRVASRPAAPGVEATYAAVEMRSHHGDDMWHKEETARAFLIRCFQLAGLEAPV